LFAHQLIDASVPVIRETSSAEHALFMMHDSYLHALPLVSEDGKYLGMILEDQLLDVLDSTQPLGEIVQAIEPLSIDAHLFNVLKQNILNAFSILPVVNQEAELAGCISNNSIVKNLTQDSSISQPGGIVVLEMKALDYSLSEISRLVESNAANIIHSYVSSNPERDTILVTLKINKIDLKDVILTFERFEYDIVAVFHVSEYDDGLKDRYDSLMMYLSI